MARGNAQGNLDAMMLVDLTGAAFGEPVAYNPPQHRFIHVIQHDGFPQYVSMGIS